MGFSFKEAITVLSIVVILLTSTASVFANGKVTILKPDTEVVTILQPKLYSLQSVDQDKIKNTVKQAFSFEGKKAKYKEAKVKVIYEYCNVEGPCSGSYYLVVYLSRKDTYLVETVKVTLNDDYTVKKMENNYVEQTQDYVPYE